MTSQEVAIPVDAASIEGRIRYAKTLAASGMIPKHFQQNPPNVLIAIETGMALGIPAVQALSSIAVINGRAAMSADLMAAVVRKAGHKLRVTEQGQAVTAVIIRGDDPDFQYTVTWDEAKARQAGLWGKSGPWSQYPMQMLRARAISEVCRQAASDALFGMVYTPEEMGAPVDEDGQVVAVEVVPEHPAAQTVQQSEANPQASTTGHLQITEEQAAHVTEWAGALGMSDYQLAQGIMWATGQRTNRLPDMTQDEAARLIGDLRSRYETAQAEQHMLDVSEPVEAEIVAAEAAQ